MSNITKIILAIIFTTIIAGCERPNIDLVTTKASPSLIRRAITEIAIGIDKNGNYWIDKKRIPLDELKRKLTAEYRPDFNPIAIRADKNARISHLLLLTEILEKAQYQYGIDVAREKEIINHYDLSGRFLPRLGKKLTLTYPGENSLVSVNWDGQTTKIRLDNIWKLDGNLVGDNLLIEIDKNASCQELVNIIDPLQASGIQVKALKPESEP